MPGPDLTPALVVSLTEWDQTGPAKDPRLKGISLVNNISAQRMVQALRGRVDIREGYQGLEIGSTSFVGRVDVGRLRISIRPKLPAMPLARLLRYAYGLRDIRTVEETQTPTIRHGLHDLLIAMLAAEVEELLHRGLARRYVPLMENLGSPRGRILVERITRQGGIIEARLPCQHFERSIDWQLNQVLRAGLDAAARMSEDRELRQRVHKLADMFGDVDRRAMLDTNEIDRAKNGLTRLTAANAAALTIIRLLHDMQGVAFEPQGQSSRTPGFLFDMNRFFQRLLSRFLHDNLGGQRIVDEWAIRNVFAYSPDVNPRPRSTPTPRPDFALFKGDKLQGFLDAKYRETWDRTIPAQWLYQLSIYALASPTRISVLLYASMCAEAGEERVDVYQPIRCSSKGLASVILRPIVLPHLAELVVPNQGVSVTSQRRRLAEKLVSLSTFTGRGPIGKTIAGVPFHLAERTEHDFA
jgi:5-methylcytosine-specific restriction enzyme subunit McrC